MAVFVGGMRFRWSMWNLFGCFCRLNEVLRLQVEFFWLLPAHGGCFLPVE